MNSERQFVFDDDSNQNSVSVVVPEVIEPDYSMYIWPCAPVLAQYIWFNRHSMKGKITLEIGAGTALPSIVAALCGADVHISDRPDLSSFSEKTRNTFQLNGLLPPTIHSISWGIIDEKLLNLPKINILLASDCFYDTQDFEDIIVTVAYIFDRNPECSFWCTYQERSSLRSIAYYLDKWEIQCRYIKLSEFRAEGPSIGQSDLPGDHTIHMYIMNKRNT